jgi:MFS family permease
MVFSGGPLVFATFAVFLLPMEQAFGWSRGAIGLALVLYSAALATVTPLAGRLVDAHGPRALLPAAIAGLALVMAGLASLRGSLVELYLLFMVAGGFSAFCGPVVYAKIISGLSEQRRGLALGAVIGGSAAVGGALMVQLSSHMIAAAGWREARGMLAALTFVVPVLTVLFFLPRRIGHPGRAIGEAVPGVPANLARREPRLWLMAAIGFCSTAAMSGASIHMVAMGVGRGQSPALAAQTYSIYLLVTLIGRIGSGWVLDHTRGPQAGSAIFAGGAACLALLARGEATGVLAGSLLLGLVSGSNYSLASYWSSRYWGLKAYGEIYGWVFSGIAAGAAAGPFLMGLIFDRTGGYSAALAAGQWVLAICAVAALLLGPYRFPAPGAAAPAAGRPSLFQRRRASP